MLLFYINYGIPIYFPPSTPLKFFRSTKCKTCLWKLDSIVLTCVCLYRCQLLFSLKYACSNMCLRSQTPLLTSIDIFLITRQLSLECWEPRIISNIKNTNESYFMTCSLIQFHSWNCDGNLDSHLHFSSHTLSF